MFSRRSVVGLPFACGLALLGPVAGVAHAETVVIINHLARKAAFLDIESRQVLASVSVGANPGQPGVSPDASRVYVPSRSTDTITVIDATTYAVVATWTTADGPASCVVSRDGSRVFVGLANGVVGVLDAATGAQLGSVDTTWPYDDSIAKMELSPDGSTLYALWGHVFAIDTQTLTIESSVFAGNTPTGIALSADGARAFVACAWGYGSFDDFAGAFSTVDTQAGAVSGVQGLGVIPAGVTARGGVGYVAMSSVFVNTGYGAGFLPHPWLARFETQTGTITGWVNITAAAGGMAMSNDGSIAIACRYGSDSVALVDTASNTVVGTPWVGDGPVSAVVLPARQPSGPMQWGGKVKR